MNNAQDPLEKPPHPHNVLLKKKKRLDARCSSINAIQTRTKSLFRAN